MPLQIRRGTTSGLPATPAEGEPLFNTQTQELLIGTGSGSVAMAKKTHTHAIADVTNLQIALDAKVATINNVAPTAGNITLNLDQLGDVIVTAPTNTQILQYNGSNWVNQSLQVSTNLDGLSDVTITSPTTGQVLKYNGTAWVNDTDATGGVGVTDGDKGDINVTGTGATWTVKNDAVTFAKMQNIATDRLLGRSTAGSGDVEEITCTAAGRALLDDADAAAQLATLGAAAASHTHAAGDITSGTLNIARIPTGTSGTTVCIGNDSRLSDSRTPTSHTHAAADIASGTLDIARIPTGTSSTTVCVGNDSRLSDARTPTSHTHGNITNAGAIGSTQGLVVRTGASGALTTLGMGTAGQVLKVNSGATDIEWATDNTGSGSGGTKTYAVFTALDNQAPASAFATLDTRNAIPVLEFDGGTADEHAIFMGVMPEAAVLTSGLKVEITWMADTATSGNVRWGVQFERMNTDADADSWDTATEANGTANGTSGIPTVTEITATTIDGITAGDTFRVRIYREASDTTNDTMSGDAQLISVEIRSAA